MANTNNVDTVAIEEAYQQVRSDGDSTNWAAFVYDGKRIVLSCTGVDHEELFQLMRENDDRVFAYVRVETGDEMSKRLKFALLTFLGKSVKPLARAKVSTDKASLKSVVPDFAREIFMEDEVLPLEEIVSLVRKVGGANYNAQA